jgi:hypothetical protein
VRVVISIQLVAVLTGLVLAVGCAASGHQVTDAEVFSKSQDLFQQYLQADLPSARRALQEEIALLEDPPVPLQAERRATVLFAECARLYTLEKRAGREPDAEVALIKARYWSLRRYQAAGALSDKELEELRSFNPERLLEITDQSDKTHTHGKGPEYVRKH